MTGRDLKQESNNLPHPVFLKECQQTPSRVVSEKTNGTYDSGISSWSRPHVLSQAGNLGRRWRSAVSD